MTSSMFPTQAEIAAALSVLRMAGYTIKAPARDSRAAPGPAAIIAPAMGTLPRHKRGKEWDQNFALFTFADGACIGAYAVREAEGKAWFLGSAARAAISKYRGRLTPNLPNIDDEIAAERKIAVPEIVEITFADEPVEADLVAINAHTAAYRGADRQRFMNFG